MTPEAHREASVLLERARDDLNAAEALLDVASVTDAIVGFHAQQAVEKALKSVLMLHGVDFRFSHDLTYLGELLDVSGVTRPASLADADRLSAYAVRLRYDQVVGEHVARADAITIASAAISWAQTMLDGR